MINPAISFINIVGNYFFNMWQVLNIKRWSIITQVQLSNENIKFWICLELSRLYFLEVLFNSDQTLDYLILTLRNQLLILILRISIWLFLCGFRYHLKNSSTSPKRFYWRLQLRMINFDLLFGTHTLRIVLVFFFLFVLLFTLNCCYAKSVRRIKPSF